MAEGPGNKRKTMPDSPRRRLDWATIAGLALAAGGIVGGLLLEKGSVQDVAQGTAAMIVLGGTLGAVLVTTPMPIFMRALRRLGCVLFEETNSVASTIETLIYFATQARKNGIVSLEREAIEIPDPFFRKALGLAVDGTDLQEIRNMMEIDINAGEQIGEAEARVWDAAGGYAPTVGIIGAVMGLIQVMKHLEDIKEVGHGIAVAFVATVYGVGSANLFFLPAANKIRARIRGVSMLKEMTLEGVIGIVEGLNPTLIRIKLAAFDAHPERRKKGASRAAPDTTSAAGTAATLPAGQS